MNERVLVAMRVADLPRPPARSAARQCGICGAKVWVAISSPDADAVYCFACALTAEDDIEFEPLTERQIADIKSRLT